MGVPIGMGVGVGGSLDGWVGLGGGHTQTQTQKLGGWNQSLTSNSNNEVVRSYWPSLSYDKMQHGFCVSKIISFCLLCVYLYSYFMYILL